MAAEASRLGRPNGGEAEASPPDPAAAELDGEELYCRRLGHHLSFAYCRRAEGGQICPRALDCWYERPSALEALRGRLNPTGHTAPAPPAPPAGKIESILAIVARVRERQEGAGAAR